MYSTKQLGIVLLVSIIFVFTLVIFVNYKTKKQLDFINLINNKWWFGYGVALIILLGILLYLDIKFKMFSSSEKIENIISELHGLAFDLILFGIIIGIYEKLRNKKETISRLTEELDDYKHWKSEESTYRRIGIIKRILSNDIHQIKLNGHNFENGKFISIDFGKLEIKNAEFGQCGFDDCNFTTANFNHTSFINSTFNNIHFGFSPTIVLFKNSNFNKCKFLAIDVSSIDFESCTFKNCEFHDCDLSFTNFKKSVFYGNTSILHSILYKTNIDGVFFPDLRRDELIQKFNEWIGEEKANTLLQKYYIRNVDDPNPLEVENLFPLGGPRKFKRKEKGCFIHLRPLNPYK